jgi:hypothetical protein
LTSRDPTLLEDLRQLLEPATMGDPMRPLRWVSESQTSCAAALNYYLCVSILFQHKARWNTFGEIVAYLSSIGLMGSLTTV